MTSEDSRSKKPHPAPAWLLTVFHIEILVPLWNETFELTFYWKTSEEVAAWQKELECESRKALRNFLLLIWDINYDWGRSLPTGVLAQARNHLYTNHKFSFCQENHLLVFLCWQASSSSCIFSWQKPFHSHILKIPSCDITAFTFVSQKSFFLFFF